MLMGMNRLVVSPRLSGTTNEMKAVSTSPSLDVAVMLRVCSPGLKEFTSIPNTPSSSAPTPTNIHKYCIVL